MHGRLDELRDLFISLAEIRSPSREEGEIARVIHDFFAGTGLEVFEDDTAEVTGCGCGNILVRARGRGEGVPVAFCAHIDTVPIERPPTIIVEGGYVRTDGETILGADDKAALAVLLLLMRDLSSAPPAADVELLLTVGEEIGLLGACAFDVSSLHARTVFVLDSEGAPGVFITSAPGAKEFTAVFTGVAAHSGIAPQDGRSAVLAAARAIATLQLGRLDEYTTANVGVIEGGTAINIIPERCTVRGEVRSHDDERLAEQIAAVIEACTFAAAEVGVDVEIDLNEEFPSYRHADDALPVQLVKAAAAEVGLTAVPLRGGGGSDGNVFNTKGLPALTLGVGYDAVHSPRESMRLSYLCDLLALSHAIVTVAGRTTTT